MCDALAPCFDTPVNRKAWNAARTCWYVRDLVAPQLTRSDRLTCTFCERLYDQGLINIHGARPRSKFDGILRGDMFINTTLLYRCDVCKRLLCYHCWTHHTPVCGKPSLETVREREWYSNILIERTITTPFGHNIKEHGAIQGKHDGSQVHWDYIDRFRAVTKSSQWKCFRCLVSIKGIAKLCPQCKQLYCSSCQILHSLNLLHSCHNRTPPPHRRGSRTTVIVDRYSWTWTYDPEVPILKCHSNIRSRNWQCHQGHDFFHGKY